jgi:hypothetical protein
MREWARLCFARFWRMLWKRNWKSNWNVSFFGFCHSVHSTNIKERFLNRVPALINKPTRAERGTCLYIVQEVYEHRWTQGG